ncbi:MAG: Lrp/AsnC ligand binding domain-containing protein [Solirubrobacteraceae bacterium]
MSPTGPQATGNLAGTLSAVIRVRPAPRQLQQVGDLAQRTPEVVDCRRITGDDCYIMTAHVRDIEHLEEVIDRFAAHGQTTTSIVQSAPVSARGLALNDNQGRTPSATTPAFQSSAATAHPAAAS